MKFYCKRIDLLYNDLLNFIMYINDVGSREEGAGASVSSKRGKRCIVKSFHNDDFHALGCVHLVIKCERGQRIMKYNVDRLKNEQVQREFTNSIDAHLRGMLTEENSGIDHRWEECYKAIKQAAIETLGERERGIKAHWFNEECRSATDKKNEAYRKMIQRTRTRALVEGYRRLRREEKRIHQRTKRAWENKKLETIENLRFDNQVRKFYREVNNGRKSFKPRLSACKAEDGSLLTDPMQILNRWKGHFNGLLNGPEEATEDQGTSINLDNIGKNGIGKKSVVLNPSVKIPIKSGTSCQIYQSDGKELGYKDEFRYVYMLK
uniref:Uncharacterized protein n=1 Tax=Rhodnius prolixus TaxID=13249 RepID=T1HQJ7_RHOPR